MNGIGVHRLVIAVAACAAAVLAAAQPPPLPPGLEGPGEEPALPPGLDAPAAHPDEPALPPGLGDGEAASSEDAPLPAASRLEIHGYWESRGGVRLRDDPAQGKTLSIGESRLQLETDIGGAWGQFDITADGYGDAVLEEGAFDLRRARLTLTPFENVDVRMGRQVLTWGTGDLLFINDLFPKDWQSFFIGRDEEYLKAPSDSVRIGVYHDALNLEFVYTPRFTPDRYIRGDYISYYDPLFRRFNGRSRDVDANPPSDWFSDDEIAWRLYRNIGSYQWAVYGYHGYWKSPGGQKIRGVPLMQATFPKLNVYGLSFRGPLGKGIVNGEVGYYDSAEDRNGGDFFTNNSEFRAMVGYERELGKDFTGAWQIYWEHMLAYANYRDTLILIPARDQDRFLLTMRLTKLWMNQNLVGSLFVFYSPTDQDAYIRPKVTYKINDRWTVESGANVWFGEDDSSFFGQFENNTNLYAALRLSF